MKLVLVALIALTGCTQPDDRAAHGYYYATRDATWFQDARSHAWCTHAVAIDAQVRCLY